MGAKRTVIDKKYFVDRCLINEETGCWEWQAYRGSRGYGQVRKWGRVHSAHRLSYLTHCGDIPADAVVMHVCDTPACVNPEHLCLGTQADNMRDMRTKGRHTYGESANNVLTDAQVLYIRACTKQVKELAAELGCDYETVRLARIGTHWAHLPGAWTREGSYYYRPTG